MRFYFLYGGLLEALEALDPSCRSSPVYLIQTGVGENTQMGIGLSGTGAQRIHVAVERGGMPNSIRALEFRLESTASWQLGLEAPMWQS